MDGFCSKCKGMRFLKDRTMVGTKIGSRSTKGKCSTCGADIVIAEKKK